MEIRHGKTKDKEESQRGYELNLYYRLLAEQRIIGEQKTVHNEALRHRTDWLEFVWNWAWSGYQKAGSFEGLLGGTRTRH